MVPIAKHSMGERFNFTFVAPMQLAPDIDFEKARQKKDKRIEMNHPLPSGR
jgi:hypothetical protein